MFYNIINVILLSVFLLGCCADCDTITKLPKKIPPPNNISNVDVAIALGAGGSKGFAHIGVLEVLEQHCIPIDLIAGSSAGAIVGSLYSHTPNAKEIKKIWLSSYRKNLLETSYWMAIHLPFNFTSVGNGDKIEIFIAKILKKKTFKDLTIPLIITTTDLNTNKIFRISSGPVAPAVRASISLPPVFSPVRMYGKTLTDGAFIEAVPINTVKLFNPKITIAVNISSLPSTKNINTLFELTINNARLPYYYLSLLQSQIADIIVHPQLPEHSIFDDKPKIEIYHQGRNEALKIIPAIKKLMEKHGIKPRCRSNLVNVTT